MIFGTSSNRKESIYSFLICLVFGKVSSNITNNNYALVPCTDDSECKTLNGTCKDNQCFCDNSFNCNLNEHPQALANKLGVSCVLNRDCNMEFAECNRDKKCSCLKGYVSSHNQRECLKVASGFRGDCQESIQCYMTTPSTICNNYKCICQKHMHEYNGTCYKTVGLGRPCQLSGECSMIPNAICLKLECQCLGNFVSNGSTCLLKANGINFTCSEDIQCQAQLKRGSECHNKTCRCKDDYHYKSSLNQCVHDLFLNEVCESHSDCHQPGTERNRLECVLGVCKCKSPFLEESGFCINSSTSVIVFKSIMLVLGTIFLIK